MPKKYSPDPVAKFLEVAVHQHLPPATKAKTLWGIAHSMTPPEIEQARHLLLERIDQDITKLRELNAPQVLLDLHERRKTSSNVAIRALNKAEN